VASACLLCAGLLAPPPNAAQRESFLLGPSSKSGPGSKIVPTNCVTEVDGTITCDTSVERPPSDTPARIQYDPFSN